MLNVGDASDLRTRIKFCGMTRPDDVRLAGALGVDAIGLIFAARSARCIDVNHALALRDAAEPTLAIVALLMDNSAAEVEDIVHRLRPHWLQFHGNEEDAFCARFGVPFLKALAMQDVAADNVPALLARYPSASGFVFDSHAPGAMGGSGQRFDWNQLMHRSLTLPWLLAGGLTAANVGAAVRAVRPWGVDVSSGIELDGGDARGTKDRAKMSAFVEAVRHADEFLQRQSQDMHAHP